MSKKVYLPKFRMTHDESLKGYEVRKIFDNVNQEVERQSFWQILPFALLIAFFIFAVILFVGGH